MRKVLDDAYRAHLDLTSSSFLSVKYVLEVQIVTLGQALYQAKTTSEQLKPGRNGHCRFISLTFHNPRLLTFAVELGYSFFLLFYKLVNFKLLLEELTLCLLSSVF